VISKRAMQESDLLAFGIAISIAKPGAVMCSYNRINADYGKPGGKPGTDPSVPQFSFP
jgi:beta-glucosidase-like glycosyl hydrolase